MFKWNKLGLVYNPTIHARHTWMQEQAQNPYAIDMGEYVRVYFNCRGERDQEGKSKSLIGFVDLDRNDIFKIMRVSKNPILSLGEKGSFDEFGVMEGAIIKRGDYYFLYYCGWTRMLSVPYNWAIGLATSSDRGITFHRFGKGPIIGPSINEPFLQAGCSAILLLDGVYHLWYTSGIKWIDTGEKPESVYQIMHATSIDGIDWKREGKSVINPVIDDESQASPTIIFIKNRWHMLFSFRHSINFRNKERGYRLGYAWSENHSEWHRDDNQAGLDLSESGWDSEMICYPNFFELNNRIFLFYCGNDFGKEGFGVAELQN
jgi:predicted GH43/DUF377 family glycosyl hydrolase